MELHAVLAYGRDGEKALIDGFQRNFRFATFLHCFVHFKGNIMTELKNRNISSTQQNLSMQKIFGKQEGITKFYGLVDSESTQEFDQKLKCLKMIGITENQESLAFHFLIGLNKKKVVQFLI